MSKKPIRDIYIVVFDSYVGFYLPSKCPSIGYGPREEFKEFVSEVHKNYPNHRIRNVLNDGIVDKVKQKIAQDKIIQKMMQNTR